MLSTIRQEREYKVQRSRDLSRGKTIYTRTNFDRQIYIYAGRARKDWKTVYKKKKKKERKGWEETREGIRGSNTSERQNELCGELCWLNQR